MIRKRIKKMYSRTGPRRVERDSVPVRAVIADAMDRTIEVQP
jgi:hypothetical protein